MDNNNFNTLSIVQLILKWKWQLIIITLAAAIGGGIFSFLIKPLYKSEAIAYPANSSPLSEESRTEQMLQILGSQTISDSIINKYNLWDEYKIKKDKPAAKAAMMQRYKSLITISKTEYEAVSIVALDEDPEIACGIVNDILFFYDQMMERLHNDKLREVVLMFEAQLADQQRRADSLQALYNELSTTYGITDIGAQSREVTRSYLTGSPKAAQLKDNLENHASELMDLQARFSGSIGACIALKNEIDGQLRFLNGHMTYSYIVTEPYPADKKCYPVRWVIVALSAFGAFLLTLVVLFIYENRKRFLPTEK